MEIWLKFLASLSNSLGGGKNSSHPVNVAYFLGKTSLCKGRSADWYETIFQVANLQNLTLLRNFLFMMN